MKASKTLLTKNLFATIAAGLVLTAFHSAAAGVPFPVQAGPGNMSPSFEHCGCDTRQGVEMYVQNLLNDAQQRGMGCGFTMHVPACIMSYCSICGDRPDLMATCMQTGMDYLSNACAPQPTQLTAAFLPVPGSWF